MQTTQSATGHPSVANRTTTQQQQAARKRVTAHWRLLSSILSIDYFVAVPDLSVEPDDDEPVPEVSESVPVAPESDPSVVLESEVPPPFEPADEPESEPEAALELLDALAEGDALAVADGDGLAVDEAEALELADGDGLAVVDGLSLGFSS